jgi:hypothetical protein
VVIAACCAVGIAYSKFSAVLNLIGCPTLSHKSTIAEERKKAYQLMSALHYATILENRLKVAKWCEENGVEKLPDGSHPIVCSGDGSWHASGYSSTHGQAELIHVDTGLVVAQGVRARYCGCCAYYERKEEDVPEHVCLKNWAGSSKAIESDILVALLVDISVYDQESLPLEAPRLTVVGVVCDDDNTWLKKAAAHLSF